MNVGFVNKLRETPFFQVGYCVFGDVQNDLLFANAFFTSSSQRMISDKHTRGLEVWIGNHDVGFVHAARKYGVVPSNAVIGRNFGKARFEVGVEYIRAFIFMSMLLIAFVQPFFHINTLSLQRTCVNQLGPHVFILLPYYLDFIYSTKNVTPNVRQ
jgi:hypothetical protein